jgi:hypothetical protein
MADAEALALDDVLARGRDVEQQVDDVVLEQVDLVDVEKAAMRAGQQPGLEGLLAMRQRALEIERADDAILRRAERQVDDGTGTSLVRATPLPPTSRSLQPSTQVVRAASGSQP